MASEKAKALLDHIDEIKSALMPANMRSGEIRRERLLAAIDAALDEARDEEAEIARKFAVGRHNQANDEKLNARAWLQTAFHEVVQDIDARVRARIAARKAKEGT